MLYKISVKMIVYWISSAFVWDQNLNWKIWIFFGIFEINIFIICNGSFKIAIKMSSYWHDFIGGWVGGIYVIKNSIISISGKYNALAYRWISNIISFALGCSGIVVGQPFDTLKVRWRKYKSILFQDIALVHEYGVSI